MNLRQLKYLYWVLKLGSYSRAAEHLDVTEPTVYRAVQRLEQTCGISLLLKHKSGIRPTNAGRILLEYGERVDALESGADTAIGEFEKPRREVLALGVSRTFVDLVAKCLTPWKIERPELRLGIVVASRNDLYVRILAGELHFAIAPIFKLPYGLTSHANTIGDEMIFVAAKDHRLCKLRVASLSQLAREQFITPFPATVVHRLVSEINEQTGGHLSISIEVDHADTIAALISSGAGIGILSKYVVAEEIQKGRLCEISVPGFPYVIPYGFVFRSGRPLPPLADSLIDHLAACLNDRRQRH